MYADHRIKWCKYLESTKAIDKSYQNFKTLKSKIKEK